VLQNKPRILILDDFPEKGRVLSKILNSKGYSADSLTYPLNGIDGIEKERPDILIFDLYFSEAIILRIFQKIRESNPSLPIFIYSDSVTEQFENQATKLDASVFFPKAVKQILDRIEKLLLNNKESKLDTLCVSKADNPPSAERLVERKKRGGDKRWQSKKTLALPA